MSQNQNALVLLASARADLEDHATFLEARSAGSALKFFAATREMFDLLREFPFLGALRPSPNPRLHSMRWMRVKGFENYLIFYRPLASKDGIVVHHLLHRSRDAEPLLEASLDDPD